MRRWISLVFLFLLIGLGTNPLWRTPANFLFLPDAFPHLFRFFEFDRVIHQGIFFPRWGADLAYGYGYPLFNFYSPLAYYIVEALHLIGLTSAHAILAAFVVIIAIGALGAYVLGCELGDSRVVGSLTAVAYVFFPYFLIDLYGRGALAEALGAAVLPWLMWSWRRVLTRQTLGVLILAGIFIALMMFSHNLVAYMSAPLLATFAIWELARMPADQRVRAITHVAGAVALGAALAAIFWLPILSEFSLITGSQPSKQIATILHNSFLAPLQLIQFSAFYQYGDDPYPLALVPLGLSALVFILTLAARKRQGIVIFFFVAMIVEIFFLLDWSEGIWLHTPLLSTSQFAWRLQALIGLSVAITIGFLPHVLADLRLISEPTKVGLALSWRGFNRPIFAALIATVLIGVALAQLEPKTMDNPRGELTLAQMARFEVNTKAFGFVWLNEYLPRTVKSLTTQLPSEPTTKPAPKIQLEKYHATQRAFSVSAAEPFSLRLRQFYFPDWQATIDGNSAPVYSSTPLGLLTVDVPAGEHRVELSSVDTPARQVGTIVSGLGFLGLVILIARAVIRRDPDTRITLGIGACLFVVIALPAFTALTARTPDLQSLQANVSPQLNLIGLTIDDARLESNVLRVTSSNQSLHLRVYWQVKQSLQDKPIAWRIADESGRVWVTREQLARYGTGLPATWLPNEIVDDHYDVPLGAAMPAGIYSLQVAYPNAADFISVARVMLEHGTAPARDPQIAHRVNAQIGDRIHLLGYDVPRIARAGASLPITLYWRANRDIFEDLTVFAQLLDADGNAIAHADGLTDDGFNPTMLWFPGTTIVDARKFILPRDAAPGVYRLVAGLYRFENLERLPVTMDEGVSPDDAVVLGEVKIPVSGSSKPEHARGALFGDSIRLLGYDLQSSGSTRFLDGNSREWRVTKQAGQSIALRLYWQALAHVGADYTVFVHIEDESGKIIAQQDRMPVNGKYPTRIWDANEQIADAYSIALDDLPAGTWRIVVGMYSPNTGERLPVTDTNNQELPGRQFVIGRLVVESGQ